MLISPAWRAAESSRCTRGMRGSRGLSLIEVLVALSILSVVALGLISMISSSQQLTNMTRERAIAANAIRSYVEAMRGKSPAQILNDTTTPANFLPSPNLLKGVQGEVFKVNWEDGTHANEVTGTFGSVNTTTPDASFTDGAALAFPRDLDGDGQNTGLPVANPSNLIVLPARVKLTWQSGQGQKVSGTPQSMVVYVYFGQ